MPRADGFWSRARMHETRRRDRGSRLCCISHGSGTGGREEAGLPRRGLASALPLSTLENQISERPVAVRAASSSRQGLGAVLPRARLAPRCLGSSEGWGDQWPRLAMSRGHCWPAVGARRGEAPRFTLASPRHRAIPRGQRGASPPASLLGRRSLGLCCCCSGSSSPLFKAQHSEQRCFRC